MKAAYQQMVTAASEIVIRNRGRQYRDGGVEYILVEFKKHCEFAKDFPKGCINEKTSVSYVRKINAVKLLDWLYTNGYAPYDSGMLVKQTKHFEYLSKEIDRMFEN